MDAQIDISEYKNTEKDYNAYDTVIISENHTVCSNKRNTECYIYKNFKDINKKKCLSRLIHIHINMKNTVRTFLFYPDINTRVSKYNKTKLIDIFLKIATFP